jgi:hypothetical protein
VCVCVLAKVRVETSDGFSRGARNLIIHAIAYYETVCATCKIRPNTKKMNGLELKVMYKPLGSDMLLILIDDKIMAHNRQRNVRSQQERTLKDWVPRERLSSNSMHDIACLLQ